MRRRYTVEGRVQGVGFRYYVQRRARSLGVSGWVQNTPDGRVEAEAAGDELLLEEFEQVMRRGPVLALVTNLQIADVPDEGDPLSLFDIRT